MSLLRKRQKRRVEKAGAPPIKKRIAASRLSGATRGEASIFNLIENDHERFDYLFERLGDIAQSGKRALFQTLRDEIELHGIAEECSIYPQLAKIPGCESLIAQSQSEHSGIRELLFRLARPSDESGWETTLHSLKERLRHHIAKEEDEVFTKMKEYSRRADADSAVGGVHAREKSRETRELRGLKESQNRASCQQTQVGQSRFSYETTDRPEENWAKYRRERA